MRPHAAQAGVPSRRTDRASAWDLGGLGVRQLVWRVSAAMMEDAVLERAASLSYYFLFALFPALLFLTTLVGLLPIADLMPRLMAYGGRLLPADAASLLQRTLGEVLRGANRGLLSLGAAAALWGASAGMLSIMSALNRAYRVEDPRPWWLRRLIALALTVVFSVLTPTALLLFVFGERIGAAVADWLGLGSLFMVTWFALRWPVVILFVLAGVALVYHLAPAGRHPWRGITPGAVLALVGWLLTSLGLRTYVAYFGNYNATYGSIGGVILLMVWLYLTGAVLLIGAELDSAIARGRPGSG